MLAYILPMRKEVWYAVAAGLLLGLIIAFGVWRINSSFKPNRTKTSETSPTPSPASQFGITIAKPDYDDVITKSPVTISGITSPESWVVISTDQRDYLIKAKNDGTFEYSIDISGGINWIITSTVYKDGRTESKNLRLVYSTEIGEKVIPKETPELASDESDIREKVAKKIEGALNNPKAYIGTVTDISEGTLQLKSDAGEIKQVAVNLNDITVIKTGKETKEIKFTDVAIGDYVVAMGTTNGNHVLAGKRILITSPTNALPLKVFSGKIKSINKKELVINENKIPILSTTKFTANKEESTITIKLSSLEENDTVIVTATEEGTKLTTRRIHLIE